MYDLTQIEVIMLTSFMDITHEKYTNNRITKSHLCGSNIIVVFLTIQYYCLSLRHE